MNYMAGFMENTESSISYYLNNQPGPGQATCAIVCHATSRKEILELFLLVKQKVTQLLTKENEKNQELLAATQVVASVFYGAEVYCVFA